MHLWISDQDKGEKHDQEPDDRKAMGMDMGQSDDVESELDPTDVSLHVGFADVGSLRTC